MRFKNPGPLELVGVVSATIALVAGASLVLPHQDTSHGHRYLVAERFPLEGLVGPDGGKLARVTASSADERKPVRFPMHIGPNRDVWCILNYDDAHKSTKKAAKVNCIDPQYVKGTNPYPVMLGYSTMDKEWQYIQEHSPNIIQGE